MSEKNTKLVIAEKPSVAQSIAKVIGADKREDGYLEGKLLQISEERLMQNFIRLMEWELLRLRASCLIIFSRR